MNRQRLRDTLAVLAFLLAFYGSVSPVQGRSEKDTLVVVPLQSRDSDQPLAEVRNLADGRAGLHFAPGHAFALYFTFSTTIQPGSRGIVERPTIAASFLNTSAIPTHDHFANVMEKLVGCRNPLSAFFFAPSKASSSVAHALSLLAKKSDKVVDVVALSLQRAAISSTGGDPAAPWVVPPCSAGTQPLSVADARILPLSQQHDRQALDFLLADKFIAQKLGARGFSTERIAFRQLIFIRNVVTASVLFSLESPAEGLDLDLGSEPPAVQIGLQPPSTGSSNDGGHTIGAFQANLAILASIGRRKDETSVRRELIAHGLHGTLRTRVQIDSSTLSDCELGLVEVLTPEVMVDPFEIENLQRFEGRPNVTFYSIVDLEMPSYYSRSNVLFVTNPEKNGTTAEFNLPIHLRYGESARKSHDSHQTVSILPPVVVAKCPRWSRAIPQLNVGTRLVLDQLVKDPSTADEWFVVDLDRPVNSVETKLPIGEGWRETLISSATLAITFGAMLALLLLTYRY